MKELISWEPGTKQTAKDTDVLAATVRRAITDLVSELTPNGLKAVLEIVGTRGGEAWLCHPEVFHWYFSIRNNPELVSELVSCLGEVRAKVFESEERAARNAEAIGLPFDTAPEEPAVAAALRRGATYAERLAREQVELQPLAVLGPEIRERIVAAVSLIRRVWPEVLDEMPVFVRKMIVYKGHAVIGFTDFRYHGSIFFKHEWLMSRKTIEEVAEDLIHEAAHVRLNALMGCVPLFKNDDTEIYPSPLRRDLRSMYGVFHQMFVLARVAEFYRRLKENSLLVDSDHLAHALTDFEMAYQTVRAHAALTPAGKALVRSIEAESASYASLRAA